MTPHEPFFLTLGTLMGLGLAYTGLRWIGVPVEIILGMAVLAAVLLLVAGTWGDIRPHNHTEPARDVQEFSVPDLLRAQRAGTLTGKEQLLALLVILEKAHQDGVEISRQGNTYTLRDGSRWISPPRRSEPRDSTGKWALTVPTDGTPTLTRESFPLPLPQTPVDRTADLTEHLEHLDLSWATPGHTWEAWMPMTSSPTGAVTMQLHDATAHEQAMHTWDKDRRWWFQRPTTVPA